MDNTKNSFEAGKAVGKNQEKGNQLMDNVGSAAITAKDSVGSAAITAKDSVMGAGKVVQDTAQAGFDYVKGAVTKK